MGSCSFIALLIPAGLYIPRVLLLHLLHQYLTFTKVLNALETFKLCQLRFMLDSITSTDTEMIFTNVTILEVARPAGVHFIDIVFIFYRYIWWCKS